MRQVELGLRPGESVCLDQLDQPYPAILYRRASGALEAPELVNIARCPEHGLHGCRTECFFCGGPVDQVEMMALAELELLPVGGDRVLVLRGQCNEELAGMIAEKTGRLVICVGDELDLRSLDEDQMRAAGWIRSRASPSRSA
ncbi:MAG TPA: hypothetical protein VG275_06955 [Solirubrobacteraceae bacterium]|nr:hypothetical protein [Solirubrobacteraceae bacterium]